MIIIFGTYYFQDRNFLSNIPFTLVFTLIMTIDCMIFGSLTIIIVYCLKLINFFAQKYTL